MIKKYTEKKSEKKNEKVPSKKLGNEIRGWP